MSDIAVLKLKLDSRKQPAAPLAVATWGDSDKAKSAMSSWPWVARWLFRSR